MKRRFVSARQDVSDACQERVLKGWKRRKFFVHEFFSGRVKYESGIQGGMERCARCLHGM